MTQQTAGGPLAVSAGSIPLILRMLHRWVGVIRKVPYQANGMPASVSDARTWSSFEEILAGYEAGKFDGIGIMLGGRFVRVIDDDTFEARLEPAGADVPDSECVTLVGGDVDHCIDGKVIDRRGLKALSVTRGYAEVSYSGTGLHTLMLAPFGKYRSSRQGGVELYTDKRYFTMTGRTLKTREAFCLEAQSLDAWFEAFPDERAPAAGEGDGGGRVRSISPNLSTDEWGADRIRSEVLAFLDPNTETYDRWNAVGMALHHHFQGSDEGLELWHEWSLARDPNEHKNHAGMCEQKWRSFSLDDMGGVRLNTIIRWANQNRGLPQHQQMVTEQLKSRIAACNDLADLETRIAGLVREARLTGAWQDMMVAAYKERCETLTGTKTRIDRVRKLLKPAPVVRRRESTGDGYQVEGVPPPDWLKGWVYASWTRQFIDSETGNKMTPAAFDEAFARKMLDQAWDSGEEGEGEATRASDFALKVVQIPVVTREMFHPGEGLLFTHDGLRYLNTFRPGSVPPAADMITPEGQGAVERMLRQLYLICGEDQESLRVVCDWIAYRVQNPAAKIRWALLFIGPEGSGKSWFVRVMKECVLGDQLVRAAEGRMVAERFNSWATACSLLVLEELRVAGHSRAEVADGLKTLVSNPVIMAHAKGQDPYEVPNFASVVAFSNHTDALPLDASDRRWFPNKDRATTREEVAVTRPAAWFDQLFDHDFPNHGPELRRFWLGYAISADFSPNAGPVMNSVKREIEAAAMSDEERAARETLEDGAYGVGRDVLDSAELMRAIKQRTGIEVRSRATHNLLLKLQFVPIGKMWWDGRQRRLWARKNGPVNSDTDRKNVQKLLDETAVGASNQGEFQPPGFLD